MPCRYKPWGVGKRMPGVVYVWWIYAEQLPGVERATEKARKVLPGRYTDWMVKYDVVTTDISIAHVPTFCGTHEPVQGMLVRVPADPSKPAKTIRPPKDPWVYHHKWLMVTPRYPFFDVEAAEARSAEWLEKIQPIKAQDPKLMCRIGRQSTWREVLKRMGMEE